MGRNALLTVAEVAEILEITPTSVRALTRKGLLRPHHPAGRPLDAAMLYRPAEVDAYQTARNNVVKIDLVTAYNKALKVEVMLYALEQRLAQVELISGIDVPKIPYNETAVRSLVSQVQEAAEHPPTDAQEVMKWAGVFLALHEEFFDLVERYTSHPKPWEPFYLLGRAIREAQPVEGMDLPHEQAYHYFNAAYIVLRQSMTLYIHHRYGRKRVKQEFPEEADLFLERVFRFLPR